MIYQQQPSSVGVSGGPSIPPNAQPTFKQISSVPETLDRLKEEFSLLQAQNQSLKRDLEKVSNDKTDIHRHYIMYYEMSYGLNVEMHKQTEIAKRLNAICAQVIPFLSQEHQQQVAAAVERAKQVTMNELNAIIGMNQQAFTGGLTPPFLPISLPSGIPTQPGAHPMVPSHPFVSLPNNTSTQPPPPPPVKEDHSSSDRDQVSVNPPPLSPSLVL
jgi:hypothetical protein